MRIFPASFWCRLLALAAVSALLPACSSSSSPPSDVSASAIEGGEEDTGDPAVGALVYADGNYCTATLIAPTVVLTAAHCVGHKLDAFYTEGGDSESVPGKTRHAVVDKAAEPRYVPDPAGCPNATPDVALVRLAEPITDIAPVPFARSGSPLPETGSNLVAVGYGQHHTGTSVEPDEVVVKRRATERFLEAQDVSIRIARGTGIINFGDSGGPLLQDGHIIGTASCITAGFPSNYEGAYGRVAAVTPWIEKTFAKWHVALPDP